MTKETFWTFEQAVNMLLCGVEEIADKTIASDDYDAKSTEDVRFAMRCVEAGIEISSPIEAEESLIAATENGRVDFRGDSDNLQHGLFRKADVLRLAHELSEGDVPRERWHAWRKTTSQNYLLLSDAVRLLVQARVGGGRGEEVAALMPFSWWQDDLTPERAREVRASERWSQAALLAALQGGTIKALMPGNDRPPAPQDWCTTEPNWQASALGAWTGLTLRRADVVGLTLPDQNITTAASMLAAGINPQREISDSPAPPTHKVSKKEIEAKGRELLESLIEAWRCGGPRITQIKVEQELAVRLGIRRPMARNIWRDAAPEEWKTPGPFKKRQNNCAI